MNIKDQIRAEIERRKKELPEQDTHTTVGADSIRMAARYDDLLAFIDTLPEQVNGPSRDQVGTKFAVEGLEEFRKEVIKFSQDHFDELHGDMDTMDIVHIIARHFAEWGAEHLKKY